LTFVVHLRRPPEADKDSIRRRRTRVHPLRWIQRFKVIGIAGLYVIGYQL
jgi:hypothetical protein